MCCDLLMLHSDVLTGNSRMARSLSLRTCRMLCPLGSLSILATGAIWQ